MKQILRRGGFALGLALLVGASSPEKAHVNPAQSNPQLEVARLRNEGAAHFESGVGLKKALAAFEAALKLAPDSAIEQFNLGTTHRKLGNTLAAQEMLSRAMQSDQKMPQPAYALGLVQRTRGDTASALVAFEGARKRAPDSASVHYQLGRLYREHKQESRALQSFVHALQLDPMHTGALYQLYLYYQEGGEADRAKAMFEEFSRVKRALTQTRRELNDDESVLARPLVGGAAEQTARSARADVPKFSVNALPSIESARAMDVRDFDEDGLDDLIVVSAPGRIEWWRNAGGRNFQRAGSVELPVSASPTQVTAETLVRGEKPRLVVAGAGGTYISTTAIGTPDLTLLRIDLTAVARVTPADMDHDGDIDLIVGGMERVLINDGAAGFKPITYLDEAQRQKLGPATNWVLGADWLDRTALDLLVWSKSGRASLLVDAMGARHQLQPFDSGSARGEPLLWQAADLDNDGMLDLLRVTSQTVEVGYQQQRYRFEYVSARTNGATGNAALGDFDNDGWKDVLTHDSNDRWTLWRSSSRRRLDSVRIGIPSTGAGSSSALPADFDGDGKLDIAVVTAQGGVSVLWNESLGIGKAMRLALTGVRSAPSSLHTAVEVRRGRFYEKYISEGRALHLPLGAGDYAEVLRISWPNGFVESKLKLDAGEKLAFKESERVSGSCPSVFAWDGGAFRFITDAFISGPMGVPMGEGRYFPLDHDEYLKIPGADLKPVDGQLRIAITEELREAVFLDLVRLQAVDHPQQTLLYPNEYLLAGDAPPPQLHLTQSAKPPRQALDHRGQDVTELVREHDRSYAHSFRRLQYEGVAEENAVEFDLPADAASAPQLRLFLTGWFHYFESTSLVAVSQRTDLSLRWPQVEALAGGQWHSLRTIGIPLGKDKTVVVDLTGSLPPGTTRLKVSSNLALYWDRILIDTELAPQAHETHAVPTLGARLRFKGFSALETKITPAGHAMRSAVDDSDSEMPEPERFQYQQMRFSAPWNPLQGRYTRYGAVDALLRETDSLMAVFGSGDELLLEFDASELPPVRAGWQRDYILYLNGFVKDGDRYTAHAGALHPTPYAGMREYPYANEADFAAIAGTPHYQQYVRDYQTRAPLDFTGPQLAPPVQDAADIVQ